MRNKKAFGILEALVALAVFGVTIVMALSLIVKSLQLIKDNEITDISNNYMITSLEYTKSPTVNPDTLSVGTFRLDTGADGEILGLISDSTQLTNTNCDGSVYEVQVDLDLNLTVCNQIIISHVNPGDTSSDYIVTSKIVYKISDGYLEEEVLGFKIRN